MADDDKRTATDILLSIESKLIELDGRVKNQEFLLKTLLGKTNRVASIPPPSVSKQYPDVINKDNFDNRRKTNAFSEIASEQGIDVDSSSISRSYDANNMVEASVRLSSRGQRGPKSKGQKSAVSQILMNGNSPLFLANIEVMDVNDELVSQTRTNTKGRWIMSLAPGDYQVHVSKRFPADSGKKPIETTYPISVDSSDSPIELDSFLI